MMKTRLRRPHRSTHSNAAFRPGTQPILSATNPLATPGSIRAMGYDAGRCEEIEIKDIAGIAALAQKWPKLWLDVEGLGNTKLLLALSDYYHLNPLTMEDVFDARHQPKIEKYDDYVFILIKQCACPNALDLEQVSIILMEHVVITIRERAGEAFTQVRSSLKKTGGPGGKTDADFLVCALIDAAVESYYPVLEHIRCALDAIEDTFLENTGVDVIRRIHDLKHDLLLLHSAVWPLQEVMVGLTNEGIPLVRPETTHYIRDCQDQARQVKELAEFYRLIASDLMNTTLAFSDNKANEVMKTLTMVATLFIPLSFLTSLYGMNFDYSVSHYNMPELKSRYGYPTLLLFMLAIATFILLYFRKKGWFRKTSFNAKGDSPADAPFTRNNLNPRH